MIARPVVARASKPTTSRAARFVTRAAGADRELWYPGAKAPKYLDGTMAGDYGAYRASRIERRMHARMMIRAIDRWKDTQRYLTQRDARREAYGARETDDICLDRVAARAIDRRRTQVSTRFASARTRKRFRTCRKPN